MDQITLTLQKEDENVPKTALHAGDVCPKCSQGRLDYDGLLNLACPVCGFSIGGCFT
jgi:uncharacterized protein (DUF983 family)